MLDPSPPAGSSRSGPLLSAVSISKRYGDFLANDCIDLDLFPAEIHALLGENGAGKSTLVKIMYGLIQPSGGELRWMGQKIVLAGPSEARTLGIGMVFQHFTLFENLNVAENVALGLPPSDSFAAISERLQETARVYGLPLDPKREVWQLSVGERQRIEIVRALMQNPKLLILDEPTSVLTPQEADQLFVVLDRLKSEGRGILYISHKLDEVKRLCDTATILRGGKKVSTCDPRQETAASLARMMVGADIGEVKAASDRKVSVPRLVIHKLSLEPDDPHGTRLQEVSLEVRGGEIVGIAGVSGNGQGELFAALSGERLSPGEGSRGHRRQRRGPPRSDRTPPHGRGVRARGAARPRHRAANEIVRERVAHRPCRERHGQKRLHRQASNAGACRPHHQVVRRTQGQARSGSGEPLRRQFAEIHCWPGNLARAGRARRQSADLGCRCRRGRNHSPSADRSCRPRHRGVGHQPGPRRTWPRLPTALR